MCGALVASGADSTDSAEPSKSSSPTIDDNANNADEDGEEK